MSSTQEELQHTLALRDEMISIACHELRTPITSLILRSQMKLRLLRQDSPLDQARLTRLAEENLLQLHRLSRLVDDLLEVSRISVRGFSLDRERFDLSQAILEISVCHETELEAAGCTLTRRIEPSIVGHWDRFRIEQVFLNLLTNAIRYGKGHPIQIELRQQGNQAILSVRDQGIGIDPSEQSRIFEPFQRVASEVKSGGLGLGLHIARQIVGRHGGTLGVTSELGSGSEFTVTLPLDGEANPSIG